VPGHENEGELKPYIKRVADIPLLTDEEETRLRGRLGSDDPAEVAGAKKRLIESQLRLVVALARRHQDSGLPFLNLVQAGNEGLIRGLERFDAGRPYHFSSWSTWWIRQAITRAIAEKGGRASGEEG
jgi:RNA polymerase primary sigma factor